MRFLAIVLATSLIAAISLSAQQPAPGATRQPIFVHPEQLNAAAILPTPPAAGSWRNLEEMAELYRIQQTRTQQEIAHAQADDQEESIFAFADVMGPEFVRGSLPRTALLSDHVKNDEGIIVNPAKTFFHRPRPYHFDVGIKPVCKVTDNRQDFSYPSGHGVTGYLEALVLAQLVPEKRDAILARADDYAHSREVCGVHYPSDEAASHIVAYAMMGIIMNNSQFRTELAAAKEELRTKLKLAPISAAAAGE